MSLIRTFVLAGLAVLCVAGTASATPVPVSDEFKISTPAGVLSDALVPETGVELPSAFTFFLPQFSQEASLWTLLFLETGTNSVSDVLRVQVDPATGSTNRVALSFISSDDVVAGNESISETGALQDVTFFLGPSRGTFAQLGFTVEVMSDVADPTPVPEPTSLLLLGSGLLCAYRKMRA